MACGFQAMKKSMKWHGFERSRAGSSLRGDIFDMP